MNFKKILLFLFICGSTCHNIQTMEYINRFFNAIFHKHCQTILENRLQNNEDLNTPLPDQGTEPLFYFLIGQRYNNDLVELFLNNQDDIDFNQKIGDSENTYLHRAAGNNNPVALKILLEKGAIIDSTDKFNNIPLHYASAHGHLECIKCLVLSGANVNHQNVWESTPLNRCICSWAKLAIPSVKYLLSQNANPNIPTKLDETSLIEAVENRISRTRKEVKTIAQLLITYGADTTIRISNCTNKTAVKTFTQGFIKYGLGINIREINCANKTAAELARAKNWDDLANFIEKYAQQRDELINKVKNNELIDYATIPLALSYVKDTQGNNLAYHALQNNNWTVLNKLVYLDPTILFRPNFNDEVPIDLIFENEDFRMKFIQIINFNDLMKTDNEQQLQ